MLYTILTKGGFVCQMTAMGGSGVDAENAVELIRKTGVMQIHSSCKDWAFFNQCPKM